MYRRYLLQILAKCYPSLGFTPHAVVVVVRGGTPPHNWYLLPDVHYPMGYMYIYIYIYRFQHVWPHICFYVCYLCLLFMFALTIRIALWLLDGQSSRHAEPIRQEALQRVSGIALLQMTKKHNEKWGPAALKA